jgi:FdrA protein
MALRRRGLTVSKVVLKKGVYGDSIRLMQISTSVGKLPGVTQAAVVMATELNRRVLSEAGFASAEISRAAGDDMIVAIDAKDQRSLDRAMAEADRLLISSGEAAHGEQSSPKSLDEALGVLPDANMALISVPGRYARREASRAIAKGLNVFLFSSNVSREDEVELKRAAKRKGLLLMGPDCGTSIINHKVLGFGNVVREGAIGIVSASGTGLQEVTTLIHKAGLGISQAIGTGGGDLSEQVGGIMMIQGIELLEADEQTDVIVLVSKPPAPETMGKVLEAARRCSKPVLVNFLGGGVDSRLLGRLRPADTLEDAAREACELAGAKGLASAVLSEAAVSIALEENKKLAKGQKYVRGLFAGGTLCYESQSVLQPLVDVVYSNAPIMPERKIPGEAPSKGHTCIDMGAEEFVEGRAHPMIDFSLRSLRILQEARDPETAVILIDVELGYGSNADPAGQLIPSIQRARAVASAAGRHLPFVSSVVGTDGDFQGLDKQVRALQNAGVLVMPSNAQATRVSALIASGEKIEAAVLGRPK